MNLPNGGDKQVINDGNKAPSNHHHYDLSYKYAATERFGEVNPFVFCYGVPDDKNVTFRTGHKLRTTSLASPLLQDLRKNLDFYAVPTKAILPHTWDFIQNNPVIGSDIDPRLVNCLLYISGEADNLTGIKDILTSAITYGGVVYNQDPIEVDEVITFTSQDWDRFVHLLSLLETLFAKDSLFAAYRMPLDKRLGIAVTPFVEELLSEAWNFYHRFLIQFAKTLGTDNYTVDFFDSNNQILFSRTYNISDLSDRMRLYFDFLENPYVGWRSLSVMTDVRASAVYSTIMDDYDGEYQLLDRYATGTPSFINQITNFVDPTNPIDIRPILAYQLVCAEYFTNDKIDFVYSADMLRKLYEGNYISYSNNSYITLNGNKYPYDGFSAVAISRLISSAAYMFESPSNWYPFSLFLNLFTRKRSLRYVDYFTGARSHPLAVGDVNVSVSGGSVSAIDMTKGIQTARYLLAVNRVGPKAKEYLKGIFGSNERTRNDVPIKIGHIDEVVYGLETQNTGVNQLENAQTITTNLTSSSNNFAFQMDLEEDTLLIGVSSYEIARFYLEGWSKFADKIDRFDHFNPYFQYTGDQPIKQSELQAGLDHDAVFGYGSKDLEYKLQTDYAVGFDDDDLRGWIFAQEKIKDPITISPDFIRAHQTELDRYFLSMTAIMASKRFHFICKYDNKIDASRNMVFDPQILK